MLRFFTVSRLALNTNLIFEIGSVNLQKLFDMKALFLYVFKNKIDSFSKIAN
jgi:hypothetical protein